MRNAHAPVFSQSQYQTQVDDTTPLGQTIFTVNATDADGVRRCSSLSCLYNVMYLVKMMYNELCKHVCMMRSVNIVYCIVLYCIVFKYLYSAPQQP